MRKPTGRPAAGRMDWLRFESRLRDALAGWVKDGLTEESAPAALFLIGEIIGEETGRGYPLPDGPDAESPASAWVEREGERGLICPSCAREAATSHCDNCAAGRNHRMRDCPRRGA